MRILIISHFDSHGVSFAAARAAYLRNKGANVAVDVVVKFPETGPRGFSEGTILKLLEDAVGDKEYYRVEIIDIPIDVRNPDKHIETLKRIQEKYGDIVIYDHHDSDRQFVQKLLENGIRVNLYEDNVEMARDMHLLEDVELAKLAAVGIVADRDRSILRLYDRRFVEEKLLPLANKLDVIVRNPKTAGYSNLVELVNALAFHGVKVIEEANVDYPPERIAEQLRKEIRKMTQHTVLVDGRNIDVNMSMWIPKTLEQLLLKTRKVYAVAVVPGFNPFTKQVEGYDVRVLRYWLAPENTPTAEEIVKDAMEKGVIEKRRHIGHEDYVSIRYEDPEKAMREAEKLLAFIERKAPRTSIATADRVQV